MLPQCTIGRIRVGIEFRRQLLDVETCRQLSRVLIHAAILSGGNRYAVFALSQTVAGSTVLRRPIVSPNQVEMKMHARTEAAPKRGPEILAPGPRRYSTPCSASTSVRCPTCL